jgi:hypothetical protein
MINFLRIIVFICVVLLSAEAMSACSDGEWWSIDKEYRQSEFVFVGEVIAEKPDPGVEGKDKWIAGTFYSLKVKKLFKGISVGSINLFSENSSGRFPMKERVEYLIFASYCDGRLFAYSKGNSGELTKVKKVMKQVKRLSREKSNVH